MNKLFKNGTIVTAERTFKANIIVAGEKIQAIDSDIPDSAADEVIDVAGKLIMPGGVDVHVHFDLEMAGTVTADDHFTGQRAGLFGGTTTTIDFIPFDKPTIAESLEVWRQKVSSNSAGDYSFHMNLTKWNDAIAEELPNLVEWGIPSMKVFTAYNGRLRLDDDSIEAAMRIASKQGILCMVHAEDGDSIEWLIKGVLADGHTEPIWHARTRPAWGAVEADARICAMADKTNAFVYIVHMNAGDEVEILKFAREHGVKAMGETCPQYLFFSEDNLKAEDGAKFVCSPPLRCLADHDGLWQGIQKGIVQVISTDHCSFFYDGSKPIEYDGKEVLIPGKEMGRSIFTLIPNGLPGVADRLPILWTQGVIGGKITPNEFVKLVSTNPAKIFGMFPQKGALQVGSDADILIWDPNKKLTWGVKYAHHRTDYNLYEDWSLLGGVDQVYLRGEKVIAADQWLGKRGMGNFIRRQAVREII